MRFVVATLGPPQEKPWWWKHIDFSGMHCEAQYARLVYNNRHSQDVSTAQLPIVMFMVLWQLVKWRRDRISHVFTIECDLVGLSIAFWQSLLLMRRPKHVIVQFIMREKVATVRSRLKYQLMRFLFRSVHRVVVSSTRELAYYRSVFGWPERKAVFVPVLTSPELLNEEIFGEDDFYLAAGRTFRDYATLLRAVAGTSLRVVVVGGRGAAGDFVGGGANITVLEDIPWRELENLMRRCRAVVVPLEDRAISTGQSVVLQAMALGKPVVATRTAGTIDYIDHLHDGILVAPADAQQLRDAMLQLEDAGLRRQLGQCARAKVAAGHLPEHYARAICQATVR